MVLWRGYAWLCAVFLFFGAVTIQGKAEKNDMPTLTVRREGEDVWSLSLSLGLAELTAGDPMALLLEVIAPDGWRITEIMAGKGADGLILTCGDVTDEGVRILLDGVSTGKEAEPILLIYGKKILDFTSKKGGYMGVTGTNRGDVSLFVLKGDGYIEEISLAIAWEKGYEEPIETENRETEREIFQETEAESSPFTEAELVSVFLGCRETATVEGVFAVQFLFERGFSGTPVICMEGGGVLYAECGTLRGNGGETWDVCTFWGLSADNTYTFWVGTQDGWITVRYENGIFCGFG